MDAAGKDGAIRHVMSGVNPQGCQVFSFKHPSAGELEHDFLWRTTRDLPERGRIGIFNRSYYEEVLIVRVHPEILQQREPAGRAARRASTSGRTAIAPSWTWRGTSIATARVIVKFFLHLSKEEQRKRFLERIDDPDKNWKFSAADVEERKFWERVHEGLRANAWARRARSDAPWYVVPADDKENARLIVSQIVLDTFKGLKMAYPRSDAKRRKELRAIRKRLAKSGAGLDAGESGDGAHPGAAAIPPAGSYVSEDSPEYTPSTVTRKIITATAAA